MFPKLKLKSSRYICWTQDKENDGIKKVMSDVEKKAWKAFKVNVEGFLENY